MTAADERYAILRGAALSAASHPEPVRRYKLGNNAVAALIDPYGVDVLFIQAPSGACLTMPLEQARALAEALRQLNIAGLLDDGPEISESVPSCVKATAPFAPSVECCNAPDARCFDCPAVAGPPIPRVEC